MINNKTNKKEIIQTISGCNIQANFYLLKWTLEEIDMIINVHA